MPTHPDSDDLAKLITSKKLQLQPRHYATLEEAVKSELIKWLGSESYPTDNPVELLGDQYVLAWFSKDYQLCIFNLSYDGEEQCAGTLIFSLEGKTCKYLADTIQCSE